MIDFCDIAQLKEFIPGGDNQITLGDTGMISPQALQISITGVDNSDIKSISLAISKSSKYKGFCTNGIDDTERFMEHAGTSVYNDDFSFKKAVIIGILWH